MHQREIKKSDNKKESNKEQSQMPKKIPLLHEHSSQVSKIQSQEQLKDVNNDDVSHGTNSKQKWQINVNLSGLSGQNSRSGAKSKHSRSSFLNKKFKENNIKNKLVTQGYDTDERRGSLTQNDYHSPRKNPDNFETEEITQVPFVKKLTQQNAKLQSRNKKLWEQLKDLSTKVDSELNKRNSSSSVHKTKKARVLSTQQLNNMELQNAYKQIQIYKKQINTLKKKQTLYNQQKINSLIGTITQFKAKNDQLISQIKELKQNNIRMKKMVSQMKDDDYIKLKDENFNLRKQLQKLRQKIQKQERQERLKDLQKSNQKKRLRSSEAELQKSRKVIQQKEQKGIFILKSKIQVSNKKIRILNFENNRQKQMIDELKGQLQDQGKQVQKLKQIIRRLRLLLGQNKNKHHPKIKSEKSLPQNQEENKNQQIAEVEEKIHKKYPYKVQYGSSFSDTNSFKWNHLTYKSKVKQIQVMMHKNGHVKALNFRYQLGEPPRPLSQGGRYAIFSCPQPQEYIKELRGGFYKKTLAFVKIKTNYNRQASYCMHQLDDVDQENNFQEQVIDDAYDAQSMKEVQNESSKSEKSQKEYKYQQNNPMLTQYAYQQQKLDSKKKQVLQPKKKIKLPPIKEECQKFSFGEGENQYIMAFFGESTNDGIIKLGCMIGKLNVPNSN